MTPQKWAPLVYARTMHVDFRLLAAPSGVPHNDLDWLRECIEGSMVYPDEIRTNVRLSLFRNERCTVFGMTCMASALSTEHTVVGPRALYLFAGYVTPHIVDASGPMTRVLLPDYRSLTRIPFTVFRPLYRHVNRFWNDKRSAFGGNDLAEISYPSVEVPELRRLIGDHPLHPLDPQQANEACPLNRDADLVGLFPHSSAAELWQAAALLTAPLTLCLGLPNVTAALRSPFENATVLSINSPQLISRESGTESRVSGEFASANQQNSTHPMTPVSESESGNAPKQGSGLGRLVGSLFRRQPRPQLEPLPDDVSQSESHDPLVRRWEPDEDGDEWIDHER